MHIGYIHYHTAAAMQQGQPPHPQRNSLFKKNIDISIHIASSPLRIRCINSEERMARAVFSIHVAAVAKIVLVTLRTFPTDSDQIGLTASVTRYFVVSNPCANKFAVEF
jgi:hypothetical protein